MPLLSDKEAAILGLLTDEAGRYGYEIEKILTERGMRYWTPIGFSSIYFILNRLLSKGLVASSLEQPTGQPARKRYQLTQNGRNELIAKTCDLLSSPACLIDPLSLGISHLGLIHQKDAISALDSYIANLTESLTLLKDRQNEHLKEPVPYYVNALFTHSVSMMHCRIQIATQLRETIQNHAQTGVTHETA